MLAIGVDIENLNNFPDYSTGDERRFFQDNYTKNEIDYCLKNQNPQLSFMSLFSVKESIIKADNSYMGKKLNNIEIKFDDMGKPFFGDFSISISHCGNICVTVAVIS